LKSRALLAWLFARLVIVGATFWVKSIMVLANPDLDVQYNFFLTVEAIVAVLTLLPLLRR
jgi:hypothetical protein